jgi:hypothetical protein
LTHAVELMRGLMLDVALLRPWSNIVTLSLYAFVGFYLATWLVRRRLLE